MNHPDSQIKAAKMEKAWRDFYARQIQKKELQDMRLILEALFIRIEKEQNERTT